MTISFYKYQGTGNDFVMIDNRNTKLTLTAAQVQRICDRRFGIGADGIILLENHSSLDFYMNYYNSDGTQSFCGNGSRCVARFAQDLGIVKEQATYEAIDGVHQSRIEPSEVSTAMGAVDYVEEIGDDLFIHTGSPHYIIFTHNLEELDLISSAHEIRYNSRFEEDGTNVNFVSVGGNTVNVRTYERGVEGETLSCGTGVTAVAIAHCHRTGKTGAQSIQISTKGGLLRIELYRDGSNYRDIQLIGPAEKVFEGKFNI